MDQEVSGSERKLEAEEQREGFAVWIYLSDVLVAA